jgi:hypothetical protein
LYWRTLNPSKHIQSTKKHIGLAPLLWTLPPSKSVIFTPPEQPFGTAVTPQKPSRNPRGTLSVPRTVIFLFSQHLRQFVPIATAQYLAPILFSADHSFWFRPWFAFLLRDGFVRFAGLATFVRPVVRVFLFWLVFA